ncbi:MAG TPA: adenylate cyclase regulatory domain-containing protein [Solirubrobacteraceae bacterium]|jgi:adenylate cyclase|nr:adenylate cyclase regulatory domain-containing protein [Solirubrobacteraceae bacterium]
MTDFAAEGLLDGLDGPARDARRALLEDLEGRGVSLEELRRAVREDSLIFLPAELAIGGLPKYTGHQVVALTGLDAEFLTAMRRSHGLPVPDPDECAYTEADLEGARLARTFRDAGLPTEDMLDITRIFGRGFAQAAEAMRTLVLKLVLEPGASEQDLALRYADAVSRLMPLTEPMLSQMLRVHLRQMARGEAISAAERASGRLPGARDVTIAFADLVGFTRVGEEVPADELGRIAGRLAELTTETMRPPVRLVKLIGDAVMLAAPSTQSMLDSTLDLVAAADAEGQDFPQLRVGVACGPALRQAGDWYGQPVNLASRVTGVARPGSVLATSEVHETAEEHYRWSFAGKRRLKGIRDPVALFRARRRDEQAPE